MQTQLITIETAFESNEFAYPYPSHLQTKLNAQDIENIKTCQSLIKTHPFIETINIEHNIWPVILDEADEDISSETFCFTSHRIHVSEDRFRLFGMTEDENRYFSAAIVLLPDGKAIIEEHTRKIDGVLKEIQF